MKLMLLLPTILFVGLACTPAYAATEHVKIILSGNVVAQPCILKSNKLISADFGRVGIDAIETAPAIIIPIKLDCPKYSSLKISVKAESVYENSSTLGVTGIENLAYSLVLSANSRPINLTGVGSYYKKLAGDVDRSMVVKLSTLGPVTDSGAFQASAVITLEYN
ncbi:type 1 fimbrial protein [Pseudomonas sp. ArH3a]|uniref:fimbrial protein n=1 Tax=Pseudomonas sp. ArH3a TaxID=2862945 RepID=UPI001F56DF33|nr:type 1 fimbrial protein [Pseudomonas sp. ArH3a]UNM20056.1 type 1 fimbrial protein [Pseudomonas sp. ArH3a]